MGLVNWSSPVNWNHGLNLGLVGWYLNVLHWQGGLTFRDLTDRSGHGKIEGAFSADSWVNSDRPGGFGSAMNFNGGSSAGIRVLHNTANDLAGVSNASWSFWIKGNQPGHIQDSRIMDKDGGTAARDHGWSVNWKTSTSGSNELAVAINATTGSWEMKNDGSAVTEGVWEHWSAVWENGVDCKFYLNGIFDGSDSTSATGPINTSSAYDMVIGNRDDGGGRGYDGDLDDLRILDRALSPAEVMAWYQESRTGYPRVLNRLGRRVAVAPVAGGPTSSRGKHLPILGVA